jgi:hypothetical protein
MMKIFGGYDAMKRAPLSVVEEQRLLWIAEMRGQAE